MPTPVPKPCRGRPRLGRELALALAFKLVLLTALWFVLFRPRPDMARPEVADLFAPAPQSSVYLEQSNDRR